MGRTDATALSQAHFYSSRKYQVRNGNICISHNLKRNQSEIYICCAGSVVLDGASKFCGVSLKDGPTSPLDFFPTVGQIGEEATYFLAHRSPGAQAHIGGRLLTYPAPDGAIGQKSGR